MTDLSRNEYIKEASDYLRGTLAEGLTDEITGAIVEDDQQLVKFHGMYLQDDRDLRSERTRKKLEKAFSFMLRVRISGGVLTTKQWRALDWVARVYGNGTMRATTRQTIQLHGVIKSNLKATLKAIDEQLMNTIAACGDVNRNVMSNPNPYQSKAHAVALELARGISDHLTPRTGAYREIWLDGERIAGGDPEDEIEPIYGKTYLPRKFKTVVAVPPSNDVDIFAHDLGFIAILDDDNNVTGWNVTVGGGMGMTHGEPDTFPRAADVMGFCQTRDAIAVAEAVVTVQRDWGDRKNRKHARLKYTIEDRGLDAFRAEVEKRAGVKLGVPKPFTFTSMGDRYGWVEGENGKQHLTLYVPNGRIQDVAGGAAMLTGLRKIAEIHKGDMRLTANQNVIVANVDKDERAAIEELVARYRLVEPASGLRRNAMACVALPTCGLALAESERYLPDLITALDEKLSVYGLSEDDIVIRMTGCPNGCARPYLAEIGLVGKGPGRYNLYLGAAHDGSRMSKLYAEDLQHEQIIAALDPVFAAYVKEREPNERFGEFVIRAEFVARTGNGADFHANVGAKRDRMNVHAPTPAIRTTCPYCGVGCGILAAPDGQGGAVIAGDPKHPANFGRLCSKGAALGETLGLETRLLHPMLRQHDGTLARIDWDQALGRVADGFARIAARHGPESIAFYLSGQLLTEDYYVANKLMKGFLGSANVDTNSRLCMASSVAGHRRAFGADTVPGLYEDLDQADLIVLVGSNAAWCHPVLFQRMQENRRTRGAKLVVIDPRRTATADEADLHLAIKPGMDTVLFWGLLVRLADRDVFDPRYVASHTTGFEDSLKRAMRNRARTSGNRAENRTFQSGR